MPDSLYDSDALAWGEHQAVLLWPASDATAHWRPETAGFLASARRSFMPSMRQRIDLDSLWADALYETRPQGDDVAQVPPWPEACPFSEDDVLGDRRDPRDLVAMLSRRPAAG